MMNCPLGCRLSDGSLCRPMPSVGAPVCVCVCVCVIQTQGKRERERGEGAVWATNEPNQISGAGPFSFF